MSRAVKRGTKRAIALATEPTLEERGFVADTLRKDAPWRGESLDDGEIAGRPDHPSVMPDKGQSEHPRRAALGLGPAQGETMTDPDVEEVTQRTECHWERGDYVMLDVGHVVHVVAADYPDNNDTAWLVVTDDNDWTHVGKFERTLYVESNDPLVLYRESDRAVAADPNPSEQTTVTPRGALLREAEALITGDRNKSYGEPRENMEVIAGLWNLQLRKKLSAPLTATDVAVLMAHVKLSRLSHGVTRDSFVDLAGYAAIGWEVSDEMTLSEEDVLAHAAALTEAYGPDLDERLRAQQDESKPVPVELLNAQRGGDKPQWWVEGGKD